MTTILKPGFFAHVAALLTAGAVSAFAAAEGEWKVDGEARVRGESREHTVTFNRNVVSVTDDDWWLTRLRIGVQGELSPGWSAHVQLQDSREHGSARSRVPFISGSEGDDPVDVRQAYLERKVGEVNWRVGRQVLALGNERLIGESNWGNFARTFDAARVSWPQVGGGLDVFVASVVKVQPDGRTGWRANHSSRDDLLAGIYSRFAPRPTLKLEPYLIGRRSRKDVVYSAGAAGSSRPYDIPQKIATAGVRVIGGPAEKLRGFDYDAELAAQTGRARGRQLVAGALVYPGPAWLDHRAWAAHVGLGYGARVGELPWRLYVEANRATGDRDPADGTNGSFFNLFPTNHRFYGGMDAFAWKNMRELALTVSTTVHDAKARIEHHGFRLDSVNDTWFRSNGSTVVRPLTSAARQAPARAGAETDLVLSRAFGRRLTLEVGASYFAAGPYLVRTGGATDARFGYLQTIVTW